MAHFHIKTKKGRPYLYIRETGRVDGRPQVVSQVYLGSPDRVLAMSSGRATEDRTFRVQEFGALWAALLMDRDVDLVGLVDEAVPRARKETGPSVGEYFLYAVLNRMVESKSKRALPDWYHGTAIQDIRPVDINELTSERYWAKWDRVSDTALETIGQQFFARVRQFEKPQADCVLFDTTNYYTYMASDTDSELAQRGNNKQGRHNLRQVGLGLLVSRDSRLPLYYTVYPGNRHDSKEFGRAMDEMFGVVLGLGGTKQRLTIVIDKGMNSEDNFNWIDGNQQVHFVTAYSPYFAQDLAETPLEKFHPVNTRKNRALAKKGLDHEQIVAYRTTGEFWGKDRSVVVTHYPRTARKQQYTFDSKLTQLRQELLSMREKVGGNIAHWRDEQTVRERYLRFCERLHISSAYYDLEFSTECGQLTMGFRKNHYEADKKSRTLGRSIVVTDNTDWTTDEIVETHLERWQVESGFRQSKDSNLVTARPVRHWTDSKIRCHLFTCVVALTYLRRLELRLAANGARRTASAVMADMRRLHSVLSVRRDERKPRRALEQPSETQSRTLRALGYGIDQSGGLHPLRAQKPD